MAAESGTSGTSLAEMMTGLVPFDACRVLVLASDPGPLVTGIKRSHDSTVTAGRPDEIMRVAGSRETFPCIVFEGLGGAAVAERLEALSALMEPDAVLITSIRNALHQEFLRSVLRSDLPGPCQAEHSGYATSIKRFLDAGFLPHLASVFPAAASPTFRRAAKPLLQEARVHPPTARRHLDASHHIFTAKRRPTAADQFVSTPLSFIACVNDELQLNANLLASPALGAGTPHEVILVRGATSIGDAFNRVLPEVAHDIVVLVQQDMYLPRGWDTQFVTSFRQASEQFAPLGVVGLFGVAFRGQQRTSVGRVVDREQLLDKPTPLPARVDGLDEILLAVPRESALRLDPALGFHLYGTDACLQAAEQGGHSVVVEAPAFHNSLNGRRSQSFHSARRLLLAKWPNVRPMHTSMGQLDILVENESPPPPPDPKVVITRQKVQIAHQEEQILQLTKEIETQRSFIREVRESRLWRLRNLLMGATRRRRRPR